MNSRTTHTALIGFVEQRDQDRRHRPDDRPDVGDELHQPIEGAEEDRVVLAVGEDPEHPEDPQRDRRARAHDQAEQQLAADVAGHRRWTSSG